MKINEANLTQSWAEIDGTIYTRDIAVDATNIGAEKFPALLEKITEQVSDQPFNESTLSFTCLSKAQCQALTAFINSNSGYIPFAKLELTVDADLMQSQELIDLTAALNQSNIERLHLRVAQNVGDTIAKWLIDKVAATIHYPITLAETASDAHHYGQNVNIKSSGWNETVSVTYRTLSAMLINNMQRYHQARLFNRNATQQAARVEKPAAIVADAHGEKIKLKELIAGHQQGDKSYEQHIRLEVQHVEIEQQQEVQQIEEVIEENVEMVQVAEQQERYEGALIDFQEFMSFPYDSLNNARQIMGCTFLDGRYFNPRVGSYVSTDIDYGNILNITSELFANLPNAVKYLTPDAAVYLANHLNMFVALNIQNLPEGFVLKKTVRGEVILDYDAHAPKKQTNVYTPKEVPTYGYSDPIYNVDVADKYKSRSQYPLMGPYNTGQNFDNLWIKYGDAGADLFCAALDELNKQHAGFSEFLHTEYLSYFPHWDHFLDNDDFFASLKKMISYDASKLACLKKFLDGKGSSQHDLKTTLIGFDAFWVEWETLCLQNNIDIKSINANWRTLDGGNPLVCMERLLTILKNARNVSEQVECLDGIVLDNYGAYYASTQEGLRVVSKQMALDYDRDKQDKKEFSPDAAVYRADLGYMLKTRKVKRKLVYEDDEEDETHDTYYTLRAEEIYKMVHRFLGQQDKGVLVTTFTKGLQDFSRICWNKNLDSAFYTPIILGALFFVAHERCASGSGSPDLSQANIAELFTVLERARTHAYVMFETQRELLKLYNLDIRLSVAEGAILLYRIGLMNSYEFEATGLDKDYYIRKLFSHMYDNKYAVFKCIPIFKKSKWPFAYALDTAEYLAKDQRIANVYRDDLLLFSALINTVETEVYHIDRKDQSVMENIAAVKKYLVRAASDLQPNNFDYAFKLVLRSKQFFTYVDFLTAFDQINALKAFDKKEVENILVKNKFKLNAEQPDLIARSSVKIKETICLLIMELRQIQKQGVMGSAFSVAEGITDNDIAQKELLEDALALARNSPLESAAQKALENEESRHREKSERQEAWKKEQSALLYLDTQALQQQLSIEWNNSSAAISIAGKAVLRPILFRLKTESIDQEFAILNEHPFDTESPFAVLLTEKIHALSSFADGGSFERINQIATEAATLANAFASLMKKDNFKENEIEFIRLFTSVDFSLFEYETLFNLLFILESMPQRNYLEILRAFFANKEVIRNKDNCLTLMHLIKSLDEAALPSKYISRMVALAGTHLNEVVRLAELITHVYQQDSEDKLLKWLLTDNTLTIDLMVAIAALTKDSVQYRDAIQKLCVNLQTVKPETKLAAFINKMAEFPKQNREKIIEIIALCEATAVRNGISKMDIDYMDLASKINALGDDGVALLHQFIGSSAIGIASLYNGLNTRDIDLPLADFLLAFEKAPFGARDVAQQFDVAQVERVVNAFKNLNDQSVYTYTYRKQLMEAFLFINKAGYDLPVYHNKPANALSNKEIQALFIELKSGAPVFSHLDPFQRRLYALGLMREAMYRTTGQFPYSTQMIALIDCMLHQGDIISNIDMGQGKSLVDSMKAALLWLDSDRVDVSTSSMVDAKRDIAIYSPFFTLLGVPHAKTAIASSSPLASYQQDGVNYGTMAQFALFYSKAKGEGNAIGKPTNSVSLVINESDYTILDDKTIYRYATSNSAGVGIGNDWLYTAINDFVQLPQFKNNTTSKEQDVALLKKYLKIKAKENERSPAYVNKFSDAQLLTWIESAIIVNYRLREKFDYVVTKEPEQRMINGVLRASRVAKILMKDGKVSPDTQYGNGMQQLLHAKLNKQHNTDSFVIEPESKTIISLNNRNMIDYYRSRKGFIWGSSGTVGYGDEIATQYAKYGFEFSKMEPHQQNIVQHGQVNICSDETAQFIQIFNAIKDNNNAVNAPPALVFLKDIESAERFYAFLQRCQFKTDNLLQLYTGMGNEEEVIKAAATPGMVTVTTAALGRNTDIGYDKSVGMTVYQTFPDATRKFEQRSYRTGRQGSPGGVMTILNQEDFPGATVDSLREQLEKASEKEREFNEALYDMLGYFLSQLENRPKAFFRKEWATFSNGLEVEYRELKVRKVYQQATFVATAVAAFNKLTNLSLTQDEVLQHLKRTHVKANKPAPYAKPVVMSDCTPPDVVAYHFINKQQGDVEVDTAAVKEKLRALFAAVKGNKLYDANKDYIAYLNAGGASSQRIRECHENFINDFLLQQQKASKKQFFLKRWLGFTGHLNKILNNENYLLMFHALTHLHGESNASPKVASENLTVSAIKLSIVTLLDEYLKNSWFISPSKRKSAKNLRNNIIKEDHNNIEDIVNVLQRMKLNIGRDDIEKNKHLFWRRRIKPVHAKGHSRLQFTLDRALALTAALMPHNAENKLVDDLTGQLRNVISNDETVPTFISLDSFKVATGTLALHDKCNAQVLMRSIEAALGRNENAIPPAGMIGRQAFFSEPPEVVNDALQVDNDKSWKRKS